MTHCNKPTLTEIKKELPKWLIPGYIPLGNVTIFEGSGGECKSMLGIDIIANVSRGAKVDAAGESELCKNILQS